MNWGDGSSWNFEVGVIGRAVRSHAPSCAEPISRCADLASARAQDLIFQKCMRALLAVPEPGGAWLRQTGRCFALARRSRRACRCRVRRRASPGDGHLGAARRARSAGVGVFPRWPLATGKCVFIAGRMRAHHEPVEVRMHEGSGHVRLLPSFSRPLRHSPPALRDTLDFIRAHSTCHSSASSSCRMPQNDAAHTSVRR